MAIKKQINIDVNASSAIKTLEELGGSFEDANGEGAIPLSTTISELEDRLYAMAAAGDTASKEFKEISGQVGKMKKVIIDTDVVLDGMSQNLTQNVGGALQGVAGGFALAQGAMGAFGAGGQAVEEALLKVQSAMAISQGIESIRLSIASFKALKIAIMSNVVVQKLLNFVMNLNPIGLIILAVAALGAGIALLFSPIKQLLQFMGILAADTETAAEANDKLTASLDKQTAALEKNRAASERSASDRRRQLLIDGASEEDLHKDTLKRLDEEQATRLQEFSERQKGINKQSKLYKKALKEGDNELAKSIGDRLRADRKSNETLLLQKEEHSKAKQEEDKRYADSVAASDKTVTDNNKAELDRRRSNYKEFLDKKLAAERRIEDLKNSLIKDDEDKALAIRRTKFARDIEDLKTSGKLGNETKKLLAEQLEMDLADIKKKATDKEIQAEEALAQFKKAADEKLAAEKEAFEETLYQQGLTKDEAEIQAVTAKYFNLISLAEQYGLDTVALKEKETAELDAIEQAAADKRKALDQSVTDAKLSLASSSFGALGNLATAFASNNEKSQKRAFKINKAVQLAQALISTYQGANAIFASAAANPATVLFPAQPFIMAGAAIAAGLANVANISRTKFQGGGGGASSASAPPSIGGGGGSQPAQFNIIGGTGINQLAEGLGGQNSQPIQTYVVSGDVTTAQGLDRNKIDTATI